MIPGPNKQSLQGRKSLKAQASRWVPGLKSRKLGSRTGFGLMTAQAMAQCSAVDSVASAPRRVSENLPEIKAMVGQAPSIHRFTWLSSQHRRGNGCLMGPWTAFSKSSIALKTMCKHGALASKPIGTEASSRTSPVEIQRAEARWSTKSLPTWARRLKRRQVWMQSGKLAAR